MMRITRLMFHPYSGWFLVSARVYIRNAVICCLSMNYEKLNPKSRLFQLSLSNPGAAAGLPADVLRLIRKMVKSGWNPRFDIFNLVAWPVELQEANMLTLWNATERLVLVMNTQLCRMITPAIVEKRATGAFSISYSDDDSRFIDWSEYKHDFLAMTSDFNGHVYVLAANAIHLCITKQFIASLDQCAPRRLTAVTARRPHEQGEYQIRACCSYMVLSTHGSENTVVRVFRLPDTAAHRNVILRLDDYELGKPVYFGGTSWRFAVDSMGTVLAKDFWGHLFSINMRTSRVTTTNEEATRVFTRKADNDPAALPGRPRRTEEEPAALWCETVFWPFIIGAFVAIMWIRSYR